MESEYDGEFVGLGLRDNLEDGTGSVREEIVIRSVIIWSEISGVKDGIFVSDSLSLRRFSVGRQRWYRPPQSKSIVSEGR